LQETSKSNKKWFKIKSWTKLRPGVVVQACNPRYCGGRSITSGWPREMLETLFEKQTKSKKTEGSIVEHLPSEREAEFNPQYQVGGGEEGGEWKQNYQACVTNKESRAGKGNTKVCLRTKA
jgi:hypothetical protein